MQPVKQVFLEEFPRPPYGYCENGQTVEVQFAFLHKTAPLKYQELFFPVMCRDFLGDLLHWQHFKIKDQIYRFSFDPAKTHLDDTATRLSVRSASISAFTHIQAHLLDLLHPIEKKNNFKLSKLYIGQPNEKVLVLESDKEWQDNTVAIASLTALIRLLGYGVSPSSWVKEIETKTGVDYTDKSFAQNQSWLSYLDHMKERHQKRRDLGVSPSGWLEFVNKHQVHEGSGINGIGNYTSNQLFPVVYSPNV